MELAIEGTEVRQGSLLDMAVLCAELQAQGITTAGVCYVGTSYEEIEDGWADIETTMGSPIAKMSDFAALIEPTGVHWGLTWMDQYSKAKTLELMISIASNTYNESKFQPAIIFYGRLSCQQTEMSLPQTSGMPL